MIVSVINCYLYYVYRLYIHIDRSGEVRSVNTHVIRKQAHNNSPGPGELHQSTLDSLLVIIFLALHDQVSMLSTVLI